MVKVVQFRLRTLFVATTLVAAALGLLLSWARHLRMQNNPARVFHAYPSELETYAKRLSAGQVYSEPDRGYAVPVFLINHGARYVRKRGACFVVIFGFMPTDAVPELWHSPGGFQPLPAPMQERQRVSSYFHFEQLSPVWAACHWD